MIKKIKKDYKKDWESYQNLCKEEKEKKQQYGRERDKNLSADRRKYYRMREKCYVINTRKYFNLENYISL